MHSFARTLHRHGARGSAQVLGISVQAHRASACTAAAVMWHAVHGSRALHGMSWCPRFRNRGNQRERFREVDKSARPRLPASLSLLRIREVGVDAHGCLPVLLRVHQLPQALATDSWQLLCVLFVRHGEVPTRAVAAGMLRVGAGPQGCCAALLANGLAPAWTMARQPVCTIVRPATERLPGVGRSAATSGRPDPTQGVRCLPGWPGAALGDANDGMD